MSATAPGPSKRAEWRIYGVIVNGAIVCTLASDEPVDSADIAAVMGIEARDVTVVSLDKVTVVIEGTIDKVTIDAVVSLDKVTS